MEQMEEKFILQRDFEKNDGLLRAIPESEHKKKSRGQKIKNKKNYGRFDDTKELKKYFNEIKNSDPKKEVMIKIINSHQGPKNLTIKELEMLVEKYNARVENSNDRTASTALKTLSKTPIIQNLGKYLSPLEISSLKQVCTDTVKPVGTVEESLMEKSSLPKFEDVILNKDYHKFTKKVKERLDHIFNNTTTSIKEKLDFWYQTYGYYTKMYPSTYMELWDYLKMYHPEYLKDFIFHSESHSNFLVDIFRGSPNVSTFITILDTIIGLLDKNPPKYWEISLIKLRDMNIPKLKYGKIFTQIFLNVNDKTLMQFIIFMPEMLDKLSLLNHPYFNQRLSQLNEIPIRNSTHWYLRSYNNILPYFTHPKICAQYLDDPKMNPEILLRFIYNAKQDPEEYLNCFFKLSKKMGLQQASSLFDSGIILHNLDLYLEKIIKNTDLINDTPLKFFPKIYTELSKRESYFKDHSAIHNILLKKLSEVIKVEQDSNIPVIWNIYQEHISKHTSTNKTPSAIEGWNDTNINKILEKLNIATPFGQFIYSQLKLINKLQDPSPMEFCSDKNDQITKNQVFNIMHVLDLRNEFDRYIFELIMTNCQRCF